MSRKIKRKELAYEADMSIHELSRNEKRLHLDECKVRVNNRNVFYWRKEAMERLRRAGMIPLH